MGLFSKKPKNALWAIFVGNYFGQNKFFSPGETTCDPEFRKMIAKLFAEHGVAVDKSTKIFLPDQWYSGVVNNELTDMRSIPIEVQQAAGRALTGNDIIIIDVGVGIIPISDVNLFLYFFPSKSGV